MRHLILACSFLCFAAGASVAVAGATCPTPHPPQVIVNGKYPTCLPDKVVNGKCLAPNTNSSECVDGNSFTATVHTYDFAGIPPFLYCEFANEYQVVVRKKKDGGPCGE